MPGEQFGTSQFYDSFTSFGRKHHTYGVFPWVDGNVKTVNNGEMAFSTSLTGS